MASAGIPRTPHPSELSPYYPLSPGAVGSIAHPLSWLMPQYVPFIVIYLHSQMYYLVIYTYHISFNWLQLHVLA